MPNLETWPREPRGRGPSWCRPRRRIRRGPRLGTPVGGASPSRRPFVLSAAPRLASVSCAGRAAPPGHPSAVSAAAASAPICRPGIGARSPVLRPFGPQPASAQGESRSGNGCGLAADHGNLWLFTCFARLCPWILVVGPGTNRGPGSTAITRWPSAWPAFHAACRRCDAEEAAVA